MAVADAFGLPLAACTTRVSPADALVPATLDARFVAVGPERLIGDKAYDSDPPDAHLSAEGIKMIAPHRRGRTKLKTQNGRVLRRYRRRWKVDSTPAVFMRLFLVSNFDDHGNRNLQGLRKLPGRTPASAPFGRAPLQTVESAKAVRNSEVILFPP